MTPLHVAVERGDRINIMKYLLNKGAAIDVTDKHGVNIYVWLYYLYQTGCRINICYVYQALKLLEDGYCLTYKHTIMNIYPSCEGERGGERRLTLCQHKFGHNYVVTTST